MVLLLIELIEGLGEWLGIHLFVTPGMIAAWKDKKEELSEKDRVTNGRFQELFDLWHAKICRDRKVLRHTVAWLAIMIVKYTFVVCYWRTFWGSFVPLSLWRIISGIGVFLILSAFARPQFDWPYDAYSDAFIEAEKTYDEDSEAFGEAATDEANRDLHYYKCIDGKYVQVFQRQRR